MGVSRSSLDLGAFLDDWLGTQRQQLKETTWASYRVAVERIKPALGQRKLKALAPLDAERLGLAPRNAAAAAKPPAAQPVEHQTWDSDQLVQFFEHVTDDRFFAPYVLAATTGMRRGEVLGLRWSDVDIDANQLAVRQTVMTVSYQPVITTPKTKRSRRVVYLDDHTVDVLRSHRRRQVDERKAAGPAWSDEHDLVFRDDLGDVVNPDWFSREFARQVKASGLGRIRFHDLRHSYATLALKAGVHPKVVSERLGHATVGITLDRLSHVTPAIAAVRRTQWRLDHSVVLLEGQLREGGGVPSCRCVTGRDR